MNKRLRAHIIFWTLFLVWDIIQIVFSLTNPDNNYRWVIFTSVWSGLADMLMKVLLFYILWWLVYQPVVKGRRPVAVSVMLTTMTLAVCLLLQRVFMYFVVMPEVWGVNSYKISFFRFYSLVVTLFDMLVPVCMLFMYELYIDSRQRREREMQLEKEKLQGELRFLKAQINPHLLFNVLGTIHALTLRQAPQAAEVTIRLSKIMRFMLYDAACHRIQLSEEIKMLEDYIALENVRFASKLRVNFTKQIPVGSLTIAPLILLPFVENAFKHGTAESQFISSIDIILAVKDNELFFEVHNSLEITAGIEKEKEKGIGLANVMRQLELLYPVHNLRIVPGEKIFSVYLNFPLN